MEVGVEVWIKDIYGEQSWLPARVHSKDLENGGHCTVTVRDELGRDTKFSLHDDNQDIDNLKLRNDESEAEVENLINLPYLHEPAILYCLQQRYSKSDIYTFTGPILIAMNPFKRVPLYTNQILEVYYNSGLLKSQGIDGGAPLSPHVYAIADAAYREMMKSIMTGYGSNVSAKINATSISAANHSILISGESGAGKTESTKIVLRYLTTVGNASGGLDTLTGSVMDKVLQSNPILESFGNAKTLRNDNSSRFGKFIELNFNKRGHLIGSRIKTYLLEKVRIPSQQRGERNFHVFYQLAAGATASEKIRWCLKSVEEFIYTAQGGVFQLRDMDDREGFQELRQGLTTLNFHDEDQSSLLDIIAGLLHLGQLEFCSVSDAEGEGSSLSNDEGCQVSIGAFSMLCGLGIDDIVHTLTVRTIVAREETYVKKLTSEQASDARDAVAKAIYGRLFDWIVYTINLSIQVDPKLVRANIGVLDIFGFECFANNSFEQLCINYTNETLQQQFNQYIFKLEQVEYQNEKIEWSFIEFPDNQDCLDLIEHRLNGILAMIDDECRLPKASDEKLSSRMYKALESHSRFSATAPQKRDFKFCIKHYAGNVVYSTITFVEKNKDEVPKEASTLLQGSTVKLLSELFTVFGGPTAGGVSLDKLSYVAGTEPQSRRPPQSAVKVVKASAAIASLNSVATQFKGQLVDLMDSIRATTPHYIRCLKPNDQNVSDNFDRVRIAEQLRYGGVLEAVRVARSGFPVRLSHADFYARYRSLANQCVVSLPAFISDKQLHLLKQHCDNLLIALWDETLPPCVAESCGNDELVTKSSRRRSKLDDMNIWKGKGAIARESIQMGLTKVFLRKPAHDVLEGRRSRRMLSAARRIQTTFRCFSTYSHYQRILRVTRTLQRLGRGMIARNRATALRRLFSVIILQKYVRQYLAKCLFIRTKSAIISLQLVFRCRKSGDIVRTLRRNVHAIRLQRYLRGMYHHRRWRKYRYAVVILQNRQRKHNSKMRLKQLRTAAKDVGRLRQSNDALKQEIESLKAKATEDARRLRDDMQRQIQEQTVQSKTDELNSVHKELADTIKLLEVERNLRQEAEWAYAASQEKLSSCELRLALVLRSVSEQEGDAMFVAAAEHKLAVTEQAFVIANGIRSDSQEKPHKHISVSASSSHINSIKPKGLHVVEAMDERVSPTHLYHRDSSSQQGSIVSVRDVMSPSTQFGTSASLTTHHTNQDHIAAAMAATASAEEKYREAIDALEKEAYARQVLEEEVSRLRQLSLEFKSQVDTMKRVNNATSVSGIGGTSSGRGIQTARTGQSAIVSDPRRRMSQQVVLTPAIQSVAEEPAQWNKAWDEEDGSSSNGGDTVASPRSSISENSTVNYANPLLSVPNKSALNSQQQHQSPEFSNAVGTFEKNLDLFRIKLKQGIKAQFWEGQKTSNAEIHLKLDPSCRLIVFEVSQSRRGFGLFQSRIDIAPIGLADIIECLPGAELKSETNSSDQSVLLTIVTKMDQRGNSRILALKFLSRDQRNSILSGLRTLVADLHVNSSSSSSTSKNQSRVSVSNSRGLAAVANKSRTNNEVLSAVSRNDETAVGGVVVSGANPMSRPVRRLSVREATMEDRKHQNGSSNSDQIQEDNARVVSGIKRQLAEEKDKQDRMTIQLLILTNDLNERDEQIAALKRKEEQFEQMLADRDNMFKQDAMVRMQLGKRLEQVLMDKEEALEQLDLMKEQVESIKASFASMAR